MREPDLRAAIARMESADRALAGELRAVRERGGAPLPNASGPALESAPQEPPAEGLALETIVLRVGRPVLAIVEHAAQLAFDDAESEVWRSRLQASAAVLQRAARAVGRINVSGHAQLEWVGTGWLVADRMVITNRHVAREFARRSGRGFTFAPAWTGAAQGDAIGVSIDFLAEMGRADRFELRIAAILHIEDEGGPDVALLGLEGDARGRTLADPIPLARAAPSAGQHVAVIGYPARDSRIPDADLVQSIFGDVYDCKRLAPGQIMDVGPDLLTHDCSTLGGNSGSVVLDLAAGEAVALHFAGRFLQSNRAVPAAIVADRVDAVRRGSSSAVLSPVAGLPATPVSPGLLLPHPGPGAGSRPDVDVGPDWAAIPDADVFVEAAPSDYIGRKGYDAAFVGVDVPLPAIANAADVLEFPWDGGVERTLHYQHFSVVMSRARRLCLFSAANLDGGRIRRLRRAGWRLDPRIPKAQQIRDECYGNAPRFSRGHMTRRADPVWGSAADAARANADSMHVTNTVPQLQPFNAGLWLGLEDYALDHAVEDDMRISVFTGPFLLDDDPVRFGVQVPRSFWKIIAFIHDQTRALSATGYVLSQEQLLGDEEFVFGRYETWQVPIATIERRAGLAFAALADADPLADADESAVVPLRDIGQIAWRRT